MAASLVDLLIAPAAQGPGKVALRRKRATWTYADLLQGAAAPAARLREAGLEPGDRVGLLFRNCPEYVAFFYGANLSGQKTLYHEYKWKTVLLELALVVAIE